MTWFPEAIVTALPKIGDLGMVVYPIWGSGSEPLPVSIVSGGFSFSGSLSLSASSDPTRPATDTHFFVTASLNSQVLLYSNTIRRMATVYNDANKNMYLKVGDGANTGSWDVRLPPNAYFELPYPAFTGPLTAIWVSGTIGQARVLELAP